MPASTWISPSSVSLEPSVSEATMRWSSAVTRPGRDRRLAAVATGVAEADDRVADREVARLADRRGR